MKLHMAILAALTSGCAGAADCDPASLEHLRYSVCGADVPWSDADVLTLRAQSATLLGLCARVAQSTAVGQDGVPDAFDPITGETIDGQAIVYCVPRSAKHADMDLRWGTHGVPQRPGSFALDETGDETDLLAALEAFVLSYWAHKP